MENSAFAYSRFLLYSLKETAITIIKEIRNTKHFTSKIASRALNNLGYALIMGLRVNELRQVIVQLLTKSFIWTSPFSNRKVLISGFNSPATIVSTFIDLDWDWLPVEGNLVIDVGGYVGDTAIYFVEKGAKMVLVYEAFPYSCKLIEANILQNQLTDKIQVINAAIGSDGGNIILAPSFENDNESHVEKSHETGVRVPAMGLKRVIERISSENAVLKMNCEGCEYKAILEMEKGSLRVFSHIQMHFHGDSEPLVEKLRDDGFSIDVGHFIYATRV